MSPSPSSQQCLLWDPHPVFNLKYIFSLTVSENALRVIRILCMRGDMKNDYQIRP